MPFNGELEDFAQAFSSGYGMVKSKEEKQAEALKNEYSAGLVEQQGYERSQRSVLEGRAAEKFGLDVDIAKNQLADAKAARDRKLITDKWEEEEHNLKIRYDNGEIEKQDYEKSQRGINEKRAQELHDLAIRKENALTGAAEIAISPEVQKRAADIDTANIEQSKAATESSRADTAKKNQDLANSFNFADYFNNLAGSDVNFGTSAVPEGPASSTGVDPNTGMNTGAGPRIGGPVPGPTSAVDVEPTVAQRAQEGSTISSFNPPDLVGPYEGANPEPAVPVEEQALLLNGRSPDRLQPPQAPVVPPPAPIVGQEQKPDPAQALLKKSKEKNHLTIPDLIDLGIKVTPEALKNSADMSGLIGNESAVNTPETDQMHANWLNGSNGASPATAEMVLATMNEATDGKLNPKERLMATIGAGYLYHSAKGDPDAAKGYAIGMVEYGRHLAGQYSAIAKAAAHSGDPDATAMMAMRAYAHVGNGQVLDVSRAPDGEHFIAHITDLKTGKTILKQLMTPDEVMAQAMKSTPDAIVPEMLRASGEVDKTIPHMDAVVLSSQTGIPVDVLDEMTPAGFTAYQQGEKNKADSRPKVAAISVDDVEAAQVAINQTIDTLGAKKSGVVEIFNAPNARDNLTPVAADIMVRNTDQVVSSDQAIRATKYLVEHGLPDKLEEYDDNTWSISIPGYRNLKLLKGRADIINTMHDQYTANKKLTASEKKERADKDASELARRKVIEEAIRRKGDPAQFTGPGVGAVDDGSDPLNQLPPDLPERTGPAYTPPASVIPQNQPEPWYWRALNY